MLYAIRVARPTRHAAGDGIAGTVFGVMADVVVVASRAGFTMKEEVCAQRARVMRCLGLHLSYFRVEIERLV